MNDKPDRMPNVPPFVKFVASAVPMVFDNSLSYYEALCALWKYIQGMTDVINNNATLEEEYIEKFNELKTFVDDYFDNLDVQEEINNKLDQMAEDGQLTQLIAQFLSLNAIMSFPNVASMKLAENLVNGSTVETYGFYSVSDNGGAKYLIRNITNDDVVDEKTIIEVYDDNLIAELIKQPVMNVKQFGAKGDNTTNDTASIQAALNFCSSNNLVLEFPKATYLSDGLTTNAIKISGNKSVLKAYSNTNTILFTINAYSEIDGIEFDGDNKVDTLIHTNVFKTKQTNCILKNSLSFAIDNTPEEDDNSEAYFESLEFTDCAGGIQYLGYPYPDPEDYKGSVKFINCRSNGTSGSVERIYMFQKLNYVSVQGGDFTGDSSNGATNIYQVNHGEVIGGYYHDMMRGVTLGQVTKYCIVTDTINENISNAGGLHIDLVTGDGVYPAGHSIISNNIVKNAHRGMYIQGKNLLINNNYIYCGSNTQSTGGVIRFNDADNNTTDSNVIVDNLYVYNLGSIANVIICGTCVITLGKVYLDGSAIAQAAVQSNNPIIYGHMMTVSSGSAHVSVNTDVILVNATSTVNIMLPNSGNETSLIGKKYTIVRTDDTASTVSIRCRSDNGTVNGNTSAAGAVTASKGVTNIIQTGSGTYWTY